MSDPVINQFADTFPPLALPTVFADAVSNVSVGPSVVKLYLYRFDPSMKGGDELQMQPVLQVVIPVDGFAAAAVLLNRTLEELIERGAITRDTVDDIRRALSPT